MLTLQNITYTHPNGNGLFTNLSLTINLADKVALVGNNGAGKSTLLQLMAGLLIPAEGYITAQERPYYVPQHVGQFNDLTVAQALGIDSKLQALHNILNGDTSEANFTILNDDWAIEERSFEALAHWQLNGIDLQQPMQTLSGGEKTKVFLAGIMIHQPSIVLLDEPSNHLDAESRQLLYSYITNTSQTLVVVSHDRALLNLVKNVYELSAKGITQYGGNYNFYASQKSVEQQALADDLHEKEKALRKAKEVEREAMERKRRLDARGKKKQEKAGVATIMMNTLRNNAEKSTNRIKEVHAEKIGAIGDDINSLRAAMPGMDKMRIGFGDTALHTCKILVKASNINFAYGDKPLWQQPVNFTITIGQRLAIKGGNGAGKTTLVKLILDEAKVSAGNVERAMFTAIYADQEYSLVDGNLTVYEQSQLYNHTHLAEHEVKSWLTHFLFTRNDWDKPCRGLSGGEKMRLVLCCLTISQTAVDMLILDEPTNNLDMQNVAILTAAVNAYKGALVVISHDEYFLKEAGVSEEIWLG